MMAMDAELLTVGSEVLHGATLNTNAAVLSRGLGGVGVIVRRQVTVGDAPAHIVDAIRAARRRAALVIISGGLGPTFDDLTVAAIAQAVDRPLVTAPRIARRIRAFYRRRRRRLHPEALRQARLPRGATPLPNPLGTAPGIWLPLRNGLLVALPGVPGELAAILERSVLPRLRRLVRDAPAAVCTIRTAGLVELDIERRLRRLRLPAGLEVGLYPALRAVDIRLTAREPSAAAARRLVARAASRLCRALGTAVYSTQDEPLEAVVGHLLVRQRKTLALAESCTGGLLAHRFTSVPGSSRYLRGGVVAYHNDLKQSLLGVTRDTLAQHGAVSAQTAAAMAVGIRERAGADVGLAVTGIAGPSGGSRRKPVGLVYVGIADGRRVRTQRYQFFGDRRSIKAQAAQMALDGLRCALLGAR